MGRKAEAHLGDSNQDQRQLRIRRSVFVSSTSRDLISHRQQVSDTLLRLGLFPVAMEQFGAQGSGDATGVSTDKVAEAEIYLGIFAWRYGYIPPGEERSVTHLEYLEARKMGLPCYLFLAHPDTDQDESLFPTSLRDLDHRAQLLAFRAELQQAVVDYFTTPDDLARKIAAPLSDYVLQKEREELLKGPRPPRDLPPPNVNFVGREQEVRDLCAALRQGQGVALAAAVSGMGGVGKSALASEVMHLLAANPDAFPGGFAFVRCDERRELSGLVWVYNHLLSAWNITPAPEELASATTLEAEVDLRERVLRTRLRPAGSEPCPPALVLLDNVERELPLTRALETLATLNISVLLTTRTEFHSPRLKLVKLEVLEPAAALTLFQRQATLVDLGIAPRDEAPATVIVQALGYLPLAIELAAPRAAEIGIAALAQEVQQQSFLGQLEDVLDPQRNMRYLLSKSLARLTPTQQAHFAALGLPAGPDWPRPVIEQMLDAVKMPPAEAASASADLTLLARLSLVKLLPAPTASEAPRVRLHPMLRQLARENWTKQPAKIQQAALVGLLASVEVFVKTHKRDFATLEHEEELIDGTLHQAAQAFLVSKRWEEVIYETMLQGVLARMALKALDEVISNLRDYLNIGGHWRLGMEFLSLHLAALRMLGSWRREGGTLNDLGKLAVNLGRKEEAIRYFEQALLILRKAGDRQGEGGTLNELGRLADSLGRKKEAACYFEQALFIVRDVDDRTGEGATLNNLGSLAADLGKREEAILYFEQALTIHREVGNRQGEEATLNNFGLLADDLGRKEEAAHYFEESLTIAREIGDRAGEGTTLNNVGDLVDSQGRKEEAAHYFERALTIHREVGNRQGEGTTLNNLGKLAHDQGKIEEATHYYEQALTIRREVGDRQGEGQTLNNLGSLAHDQGKMEEAAHYYEQALLIRRQVGDRSGELGTLNNLGHLAYQWGDLSTAVRYLKQAVDVANKIGAVDSVHLYRENLAVLERILGKSNPSVKPSRCNKRKGKQKRKPGTRR